MVFGYSHMMLNASGCRPSVDVPGLTDLVNEVATSPTLGYVARAAKMGT